MKETGKDGYQSKIINRLHRTFPSAVVLKNDSEYMQGIPDLSIFLPYSFWAMLEVKLWPHSLKQPNQEHYVDVLNDMSFAAFVNQENEDEVFDALQSAYESHRQARVS